MGRNGIDGTRTAALVTGASRGIGRAVALELARAGHFVFVNYARDEAAARATLKEITEAGGDGETIGCDVADPRAIAGMFGRIEQAFPSGLTVLINNAGSTDDALLVELDEDALDSLIRVNLVGALLCAKYAVPAMMVNRYGRIVNVSSVLATRPNRGVCAYAASKGALESMTRALALELGTRNITVNAVAPGFVLTRMTEGYAEQTGSHFSANAVRRPGRPDEIAAVVCFLASREASFVNGQVVTADGGPHPFTPSSS